MENKHLSIVGFGKNRAEADFYPTPESTTEALMQREKFEGNILEPCCGKGAISEVLKSHGYEVISSDKIDYNYGKVEDLFNITLKQENIITNPPFNQKQARFSAVKKHLLSITKKKLALLWFVKNIGNEIESPTHKHLKVIYVFNQKILFKEISFGWLFAWYVWDKDYNRELTIKRVNLDVVVDEVNGK